MAAETHDSPQLSLPGVLEQDALGQVYVHGHRVTLFDVVTRYNEGLSPEMLVGHVPTLPLALVHKVVALYLEHLDEVDGYIRREVEASGGGRGGPGDALGQLRRRVRVVKAG